MEEKPKVIQDAKLAVQIAQALKDHQGPLTLNLSINQSVGKDIAKEPLVDVLAYVEQFPQPRLKNFVFHVIGLLHRKMNGNRRKMGAWLGMNPRSLYPDRMPEVAELVRDTVKEG
jgi:hypothetical protein